MSAGEQLLSAIAEHNTRQSRLRPETVKRADIKTEYLQKFSSDPEIRQILADIEEV